ncbi:MAG: zf-HC2 domain-containing protein [Bacillota bacterium]
MLDCSSAHEYIDLYVDHELGNGEEQELKKHLHECSACQERLLALQKTIALLGSLEQPKLSSDFTQRILSHLPASATPTVQQRWNRQKSYVWRYAAAAAVLVLIISSGWLLSKQVPTAPLAISSDPDLIRQGSDFVLPQGKTVEGNLTVIDGSLIIYGKVTGDVTVVRGQLEMGPTAQITGKTTTIDRPLARWQYLWLNLSEGLRGFAENLRHIVQK